MAEKFHNMYVYHIVLIQVSVDTYMCLLMFSPSDLWTASHQNYDSNARDLDSLI